MAAVNCDFDRDGDIDVFVMHRDEPPILYKNTSKSPGTLVKLNGDKNNRDGIGAKITIDTGSEKQTRTINIARGYLSSDEPIAHLASQRIQKYPNSQCNGLTERHRSLKI